MGSNTLATQLATGISLTSAGPYLSPFTITQTGTVSSGVTGVYAGLATPILTNSGLILAAGHGVDFTQGGTILNAGTILTDSGSKEGILLGGRNAQADTVINSGAILSTVFGYGVEFRGGGLLVNGTSYGATARIAGSSAIYAEEFSTILNRGTLDGTFTDGVFLFYGGTVSNAGTIIGASDAISFLKGSNNRVIDQAGGVFVGDVVNHGNAGTLEFAGVNGTLTGLGTSFTGFTAMDFDPGARFVVAGAYAGFANVAIAGFGAGSTLDVTDFAATSYSVTAGGLVISNATASEMLDLTGSLASMVFALAPDRAGGTDITGFTPTHTLSVFDDSGVTLTSAGAYRSAFTVTSLGIINDFGSGVYSALPAASLLNEGIIFGTSDAVDFTAGGTIVNAAGAQLGGGVLLTGGTLDAAGQILGQANAAVQFFGAGNRLILESGVQITGMVAGNADTVLELAAPAGTLNGLGTSFTNFGTLQFDPGVAWSISASAAGLESLDITGFTPGNTIDITDFAATGYTLGSAGLTLSNASAALTLDIAGTFNTGILLQPDGAAGTDLSEVTPLSSLATALTHGITLTQAGAYISPFTLGQTGVIAASTTGISSALPGAYLYTAGNIAAATGIAFQNGGTVIDAGTILAGTAASFGAGGAATFLIEPDAVLQGALAFNPLAPDTLKLGLGTLAGELTGIGVSITGFSTLAIAPGAQWQLAGTAAGLASAPITGFSYRDTLDITNFSATSETYVAGTGLILSNAGASVTLNLQGGNFQTSDFTLGSYGATGVQVTESAPTDTLASTLDFGITLAPASEYGLPFTIASGGEIDLSLSSYGSYAAGGFYAYTYASGGGVSPDFARPIATADPAPINNTGRLINVGVWSRDAGAAVVNHGAILSGSGLGVACGVNLERGGSVTNFGDGPSGPGGISVSGTGIVITGGTGTVLNYGTITATVSPKGFGGIGVDLVAGGNITNGLPDDPTATILSDFTAVKAADQSTIVNNGSIKGGDFGINAGAGTTVTNTGTITGKAGGILIGGGYSLGNTVVNSGTIDGGSGASVQFFGGVNNLVVANPGADFKGPLSGSTQPGAKNTLELTNGDGLFTATLIKFQNIVFDDGGNWEFDTPQGSLGGETFVNFHPGDQIHVTDFNAFVSTYVTGTGLILTDEGGHSVTIHLTGHFKTSDFTFSTTTMGSVIEFDPDHLVQTALKTGIELTPTGPYQSPLTVDPSAGLILSGPAIPFLRAAFAPALINPGVTIAIASTIANSYVLNYGTILGRTNAQSTGIAFYDGGTIINAGGSFSAAIGTIDVDGIGIFIDGAGTVQNYGSIQAGSYSGTAGTGIYLASLGTILNAGSIFATGTAINAAAGGTVENAGAITGAVTLGGSGANRLILDPGASFTGAITGSTSATNTLELTAGAGTLAAPLENFQTIAFDPGAEWTIAANSAELTQAAITGLTIGATIDLTDFAATSASFAPGAGLILANASATETLDITSSIANGFFSISSDGAQGTLIEEVTCFRAGTRIATPRGEIPVEALHIGDLVRTQHAGAQPIKWIGQRRFAAPFCNHANILPIRIAAGALGAGIPARDLYLSPGHALAIYGRLIHAALLVNGTTITQLNAVESVEYFHLELATHEIIFAENTPAETYRGEEFRNQFQNAAEFARLYPGASAPSSPCLPPLAQGFALHRRPPRATKGMLRGSIDILTANFCAGWAQAALTPDEPVLLDILCGTRRIARALANQRRDDLTRLGIGAHAFEISLPPHHGPITVRRAQDGAPLAENLTQAA